MLYFIGENAVVSSAQFHALRNLFIAEGNYALTLHPVDAQACILTVGSEIGNTVAGV